MTKINRFATRQALMTSLAECVAAELDAAITARGQAVLAVPGGTTPAPFFDVLSMIDIKWHKVSVMLTDERFVPEDSERSNTRLLKQRLLQNHASKAGFVPFYQPAERPEDVLPAIIGAVDENLPLDVCVLGMGLDMHTASLFPEADLLAEALAPDAASLFAMRAPGAPEPRITLSANVLSHARNIHILITGEDKITALEQAMQKGPIDEAPIRCVLGKKTNSDVYYSD